MRNYILRCIDIICQLYIEIGRSDRNSEVASLELPEASRVLVIWVPFRFLSVNLSIQHPVWNAGLIVPPCLLGERTVKD
jgi:hypothetical protein